MIDVKRPVKTDFPGYFRAPIDEFTEMSKNGVVAAYLYSSSVLASGENCRFDKENNKVRPISKKGVTVAPVSLFTRFLGASLEAFDGGITLSLGEKRVRFGEGSKLPLYSENGTDLVPIIATAEALGLSFGVFHKDRLFVFAEKDVLDALSGDYMLVRGACYAVFGKYDPERFTHEDFVCAKDKWRKILVGTPEINDLSDPDAKKKIDAISDTCEEKWKGLHKEKGAVALFGENVPTESSDLLTQYEGVWQLCRGFGTYGSRSYKNEELKNDILFCYEWMYENMYGESVIEGRGWRDPHLFNWWEWMTGAIEPMTDGLLVMEEFLDVPTLAKYFRCYDYVSTFMRVPYSEEFAATRLKVGTKVALLLEDRERLFYRFLDYDLRFEPLGPEKGKYCDHNCWTHGFPYNMQYGLGHMHRTVFVTSALTNTPIEYTSPDFYDMFLTVKYMYDAAMYRGRAFAVYRGRLFGHERGSGTTALTGVLSLIGVFGEEEDQYFKKMIKTACADPVSRKMLINSVSLTNLAKLKEILSDDAVSDVNDKEMAHSWFTADRFAQHRNDYAFMLAMSSSRHMSYESINSAHKIGWYTGDGALYLYTNSDTESFDFQNFLSNINICYRIPGVTADARERKIWSHKSGWKPRKCFTGSMDFDGKYGIGALDYEPYHYGGHEADGTVDDGYGGGHVYHENDLTAKKSYHFFDKECVCLGTDITSTMNSPVRTTAEHRRLPSGGEVITVNGKAYAENFEEKLTAPTYVHISGVAGYVFPVEENVYVHRYTHDSTGIVRDGYVKNIPVGTQDYVELGVDHGTNPCGSTYAYIILPLLDENSTRVYASAPEIEILANTPDLQAVRKPSLGITSLVFYKEGKLGILEARIPSVAMYRETGDEVVVSVCDPTQLLEYGEFAVDGSYEVVSLDPELTVEHTDGKCILKADLKDLAGKNLTAVFKRKN